MNGSIEQLNETADLQPSNFLDALAYDCESQDSCIIEPLNSDERVSRDIRVFNQTEDKLGSIESKKITKYTFSYLEDLIRKSECDQEITDSYQKFKGFFPLRQIRG